MLHRDLVAMIIHDLESAGMKEFQLSTFGNNGKTNNEIVL